MRLEKFIVTKNYRRMSNMLAALDGRRSGTPGLGIVYGRVGLGKTSAVYRYAVQNDSTFLYAEATWTPRRFLNKLCVALGESPASTVGLAHDRAVSAFGAESNRKIVFIDEGDRLARNWKLIETVRDLHYRSGGVPFVLVWTGGLDGSLDKFPQFRERVSSRLEFSLLDLEEIAAIAQENAGIILKDDICEYFAKKSMRIIRWVVIGLNQLERLVRANPGKPITKKMIDMIVWPIQETGSVDRHLK